MMESESSSGFRSGRHRSGRISLRYSASNQNAFFSRALLLLDGLAFFSGMRRISPIFEDEEMNKIRPPPIAKACEYFDFIKPKFGPARSRAKRKDRS